MTDYRPFPIYDFRTGFYKYREPWLMPVDAFKAVVNGYIYRGVLQKRTGYKAFGRIVHTDGEVNSYPGNPVMGIVEYFKSTLTKKLLAFDTKRANQWNPTTEAFEDISGADTFTGADYNFFRFCNTVDNVLYITNGIDKIHTYDGTTLKALDIDFDGDSNNDINTCKMIFEYKGHLVLLAPTEKNTFRGQRARYSAAADYSDYPNSFYNDCPTFDEIQAAGIIADELIVWFKYSVWRLKYTGDARLPFEWEQVSEEHGCYAPMSFVKLPRQKCRALSSANLIECDMYKTYEIDQPVQDTILDYNLEGFKYSYGARVRDLRQAWVTLCAQGSSTPDRILVQNYEEGAFSVYNLAVHCLGTYDEQTTLILDSIEEKLDDIDWSFDDVSQQAGFPMTLAGTLDGYVVQLNIGSTDGGTAINFEVESAEWNPFAKDGYKARLGFIDFFLDASDEASLTVEFYNDTREVAHTTKTLSFAGAAGKKKFWTRLHVGSVGEFHRIKLSGTAGRPKIHAIIPWFKEAGPILI